MYIYPKWGKLCHSYRFKCSKYACCRILQLANTLLIGDREILGLRNKKTTIKHQIKGQVKDIKRVDDYIVISRDEKVEIFKITYKKNKKTK